MQINISNLQKINCLKETLFFLLLWCAITMMPNTLCGVFLMRNHNYNHQKTGLNRSAKPEARLQQYES